MERIAEAGDETRIVGHWPGVASLHDLSAIGRGLTAPTVVRWRSGEGALLLVNCAWLAVSPYSLAFKIDGALLSLASIFLLYAYNDLADADADLLNPRKNQELVRHLSAHRALLLRAVIALTVGQAIAALFLLGPMPAFWFAAVAIVNVLYSAKLKGVPGVDLVATGVWGACFVAAMLPPVGVMLLIAQMTAVSHIFQMRGDRQSDTASGIATTAAFSRSLPAVLLALLCANIAATAWFFGPHWIVPVALIPIAGFVFVRSNAAAWGLTRGAFGCVYVAVLWFIHEGS